MEWPAAHQQTFTETPEGDAIPLALHRRRIVWLLPQKHGMKLRNGHGDIAKWLQQHTVCAHFSLESYIPNCYLANIFPTMDDILRLKTLRKKKKNTKNWGPSSVCICIGASILLSVGSPRKETQAILRLFNSRWKEITWKDEICPTSASCLHWEEINSAVDVCTYLWGCFLLRTRARSLTKNFQYKISTVLLWFYEYQTVLFLT